jgi:hypothetical protein
MPLLLLLALLADPAFAEIRVTDAATGRGVPLVELETVHGVRFVTDNAGRVAFLEPGLTGRELFLSVRGHGYEAAKDGFGVRGVKVTPVAGAVSEVKLKRTIVAERLGRLTGEGLFRDTVLLGRDVPLVASAHPGRVAGQDSVQAAIYRGKVYWLWGDTARFDYPLGLFRTAGATTALPTPDFDPANGLAYDYFTDAKTGFVRAMMSLKERPEGVIWIFALFTVPDAAGLEKLAGHYSRRQGLGGEFEQGIAVFDDATATFVPAKQLPLTETWRRPVGHPIVHDVAGVRWLLFGSPNPNVRVPATLADALDPAKYEAFTCAKADGTPDLGADGKPAWRWQTALPPTGSKEERAWVEAGELAAPDARFLPADASDAAKRVTLHTGSVRWNAYRKKWVLLAGQIGGTSHLGEVWYAEADAPTGPFTKAVKVASHGKQTFYNVSHHAFFDRDGGRTIHFEGTYTNEFSGNPYQTPRYNYNQVLYRLNLDASALQKAR